jgi:Uma2 family endonuclease
MADAAQQLMSVEDFFLWQDTQDTRFELVEGYPLEMMTGASGVHDRIVTNIIANLHAQLGDGPCRPTTAGIAIRTRHRSIRRPDVTVTCDTPRVDVFDAREPRMVVEVLSPSNIGVPWDRKLNEYKHVDGLQYILLVDTRIAAAKLYRRTSDGTWDDVDADGLDAVIDLSLISCALTMQAIYQGTGIEA